MHSNEAMLARARQICADWWVKNEDQKATKDDFYVVWFCKTLQNWKAIVSTDLGSGRLWEVTHNGDKRETYLDTYLKHKNVKILDSGRQNEYNFGDMIEHLRKGGIARRAGWNGVGIFVALQVPDENSKMTHEYIYMDTTGLQTDNPAAPKDRVPWLASQTDMLAEDWVLI